MVTMLTMLTINYSNNVAIPDTKFEDNLQSQLQRKGFCSRSWSEDEGSEQAREVQRESTRALFVDPAMKRLGGIMRSYCRYLDYFGPCHFLAWP